MSLKKAIQIILASLILSSVAVFAQEHIADSHAHALPPIVFKGLDYAFDSPDTIEAGLVTLDFENIGKEDHHLQIARISDGVNFEEFMAKLQTEGEAAFALLEAVGGVGILQPGKSQSVTVDLQKPGLYIALCVLPNGEGIPHLALGMIKPIEVVASKNAAMETPQADLEVHMLDFGYDLPSEIEAGKQTWEVFNAGAQPHELLVAKLRDGKTVTDVMTFLLGGEQGEAPYEFQGGAQGMATGYSNFVNFDLAPGEYVALCFIPDPATGKPHVALGMVRPFTVIEKVAQR
jgi:plastocyanin